MAHSALRSPTLSSQFSLHKHCNLYNRPTLSHWNSIHKCKRPLESKCRALKWETDSSNTEENRPKKFDGDFDSLVNMTQSEGEDKSIDERERNSKQNENETLMLSVAPLSYLVLAALPGADTIRSGFGPFAELVKTWNLPDWLVHWGHPGNMAVVLFAMGGYGSYLGWQIRLSDDVEVKAKAKDLHPKLLAGMFFFFALGATGGITSLLTSDKPILESPHAITGLIGLSLLTIQTVLPTLFEIKSKKRILIELQLIYIKQNKYNNKTLQEQPKQQDEINSNKAVKKQPTASPSQGRSGQSTHAETSTVHHKKSKINQCKAT